MAGEKSKNSGEFGEKIVTNFLDLIGWTSAENGITIDCVNDEHGRTSKTHGIDGYFGYKSKLLQYYVQEDILISVKHTVNKYPSNPTTKFKEHLKDLAEGIDCFPQDEKYSQRKIPESIQKRVASGVIFWISQADEDSKDIINKVSNFRNTDKLDYGPIYLVDNNKLSFILQSINYAKRHFSDYNFAYHATGFNQNNPAESMDFGKVLPVQLINTSLLALKVTKGDQDNLAIFVNENFSEDSLKRVFGFAKVLASSWPKKTFIFYGDYHNLDGKNTVKRVKTTFNDREFTDKVEVKSYIEDIASLGGEENE